MNPSPSWYRAAIAWQRHHGAPIQRPENIDQFSVGLVRRIDDQNLKWFFGRFQFEAQLLFRALKRSAAAWLAVCLVLRAKRTEGRRAE